VRHRPRSTAAFKPLKNSGLNSEFRIGVFAATLAFCIQVAGFFSNLVLAAA
jgi:hypothetical protein